MIKPGFNFHKILIIANFSVLLAAIIISLASIDYINQENLKAGTQLQKNIEDKPASEILAAGDVGEVEKVDSGENTEAPAQEGAMPPVIFNVMGSILDIKNDRLIVKSDGSNFADNISRELNAVFVSETVTFVSSDQKTSYQGLEGLKYLKIGDKVLIDGVENIRGKTAFAVGTVNLIQ